MHRRRKHYLRGIAAALALLVAGYLLNASPAARPLVAALLCAAAAYSATRFQARARARGPTYMALAAAALFAAVTLALAWLASGRQSPPWLLPAAGGAIAAGAGAAWLLAGPLRDRKRAPAEAAERTPAAPDTEVVDAFHRLYYGSGVWADTRWMGVRAVKCPLDLWVYQEIIHSLKPDVIVETGTADGGTALFLATLCDLAGNGRVISIDIEGRRDRPDHPRITYLRGSSTDPRIADQVRAAIRQGETVLALLDSDHSETHVLQELSIYSGLVTPGSYLIVEDTNIGHPVLPDEAPGPMEAVEEFLAHRADFAVDRARHKFHLTFNPNGYLKKLS